MFKKITNETIVKVSIFVFLGITAIFYMSFYRDAEIGGVEVKIMLSSADGVFPGTNVNYAGKKIGSVQSLEYSPIMLNDIKYNYIAYTTITKKVSVFNGDIVKVSSAGILGEKSINISPGNHDESEKISFGATLFAENGRTVEDATNNMIKATDTATQTIQLIGSLIETTKSDVSSSIKNMSNVLDDLKKISSTSLDSNIIAKFQLSIQQLNSLLQEINESAITLNSRDMWINISESVHNIRNITDSLSYIVDLENIDKAAISKAINSFISMLNASLEDKNSSLNKIMSDPRMYNEILSLITRANNFLYDVNKFGMFFTSNRAWQKERMPNIHKPQPIDRV